MAGLSISSGSGGSQATTQSPQSLVGSGSGTASTGSVQPGTATSLLTSTSGIALHPAQLSTVSFNSASATASSAPAVATTLPPKHHLNSGLLAISIGLVVIAAAAFLMISRSAKNTTDYY